MDSVAVNIGGVAKNIEVIYTAVVAIIGMILAIWGHYRITKAIKIAKTGEK